MNAQIDSVYSGGRRGGTSHSRPSLATQQFIGQPVLHETLSRSTFVAKYVASFYFWYIFSCPFPFLPPSSPYFSLSPTFHTPSLRLQLYLCEEVNLRQSVFCQPQAKNSGQTCGKETFWQQYSLGSQFFHHKLQQIFTNSVGVQIWNEKQSHAPTFPQNVFSVLQ